MPVTVSLPDKVIAARGDRSKLHFRLLRSTGKNGQSVIVRSRLVHDVATLAKPPESLYCTNEQYAAGLGPFAEYRAASQ
jgi:hypothetical protein